ncbi:MAG TPA: hypothetical protein VJ036_00580 [bacterium]|jgi:hypothetical protein|nr:hypothetical protein [bacterium]
MVRCTVIETSGPRQGWCDLCDHHCKCELEGIVSRCPYAAQTGGCIFYQRAYYIKPLEPNPRWVDSTQNAG